MNDVDSWLSILAGLVVAYRRPSTNAQALAQHLLHLIPDAAPVFKKLKINQKLYTTAIRLAGNHRAVGRGGMPSPAYATALLAIRRDLAGSSARKSFLYSRDVSRVQQQLANMLQPMLVPDTATIVKKDANLDRKISQLPDKMIRGWMVPLKFAHEQPQQIAEAKHIMRKLTGNQTDSLALSVDQRKALSERDPKRYKRMSELIKAADTTWKTFVRAYVRREGKHARISDLQRAMLEEKILHSPFDQLIKARLGNLRIDEDCKLYTPDDHLLKGGIPPLGSRITTNPKYLDDKSTYLAKFQVPGSTARGTLITRADVSEARSGQRFAKVMKLIPEIPKLRPQWLKGLSSGDPTTRTLAAMAEIGWETAMRIGSEGNKVKDEETYGLSTLLVGQVRVNGDTLIMTYPGKDNIPQRQVLSAKTTEHRRAVAIVARLLKDKRKSDWLWTDSRGDRLTGGDVNRYLRSVGFTATIHKFRHIRGTMMMQELLNSARIPKRATLPQVEARVKKLAVDVGALLGHKSGKIDPDTGKKEYHEKAATAIKNYIVPKVIADFFDARKMRVPHWVPQAGRVVDDVVVPKGIVIKERVRRERIHTPGRDRQAQPARPEGSERISRDPQPARREPRERQPRAPTRKDRPLDLDF